MLWPIYILDNDISVAALPRMAPYRSTLLLDVENVKGILERQWSWKKSYAMKW